MSNFIIRQNGSSPIVAEKIWHVRFGAIPWFLGALAGLFIGMRLAKSSKLSGAQLPKDWPVNFAHRGGADLAPEDTLVGFRKGWEAGAGGLELDVHTTADGHVVVIHDERVDRTTNGVGLVREMTLAEIDNLDAGYKFTQDGKTYPYRDKGITVPTLEEVYRECPDAPINIEIKGSRPGIELALWRVIEGAKAEERTLVVSGDPGTTHRFREISGGRVATGASIAEMIVFYLLSRLGLGALLRPAYQAIQVSESFGWIPIITPRFVRAAHEVGVRVDAWTVNEEPDMRQLLGYGVDGIMTDRPDILAHVLRVNDEVQ